MDIIVTGKIILGFETESRVNRYKFPVGAWIAEHGTGGTFHLLVQRPTDTAPYPATFTSDDSFVYWTPTETDLAYAGEGKVQLDYTFGTSGTSTYKKACSKIFPTLINESLGSAGEVPAAYQSWVTQVENYATRAEDAAEDAEESAEQAAASAASMHSIPAGGTTGQVLKKQSATDYDATWQDESGGGGGGTSNFDSLTNRPSYNGTTMTHSTDIPEVKTANWDEAYTKSHEHSNKSILDSVTSALVNAWNAASTWITTNGTNVLNHIANSVIHITANERTAWNAKASATDIKSFVATYGTTTATEIATAITAGKAIFCKCANGGVTHQLMLVDESDSKYGFAETTVGTIDSVTSVAGITIALSKSDNVWEVLTGSGSIPTKTSDLTNDSGFLTEHQSLSAYRTSAAQDVIDNAQSAQIANKQAQHGTATASLPTASWSNKAQTVSVSGVTASNTVIVSAATASTEAWGNAKIYCSAQASGTLTFTCLGDVPSVDVTANIVILN